MKANGGNTVRCSNPSCVGADRRSQSLNYTQPICFFFTIVHCDCTIVKLLKFFNLVNLSQIGILNLCITLNQSFLQHHACIIELQMNTSKIFSEHCSVFTCTETIGTIVTLAIMVIADIRHICNPQRFSIIHFSSKSTIFPGNTKGLIFIKHSPVGVLWLWV